MNLLVTCPTYFPHRGGAESLFDDLTRLFVKRGHRVTVITGTPSPGADAMRDGVEIVRVSYPGDETHVRLLRRLTRRARLLRQHFRLIREKRIDAVCIGLFNLTSVYVLALAPFLHFRVIIYLHGGETRSYQRRSRLFRLVYRHGLRRCHALVAVSEDLRLEAITLVPKVSNRSVVIPNGICLEAIRAAAPVGPPGRFFLFAGRLEAVKNVACVLRAFAKAAAELKNVNLVVAGGGSLELELRQLAGSLGVADRVTFTGIVGRETVWGLMQRAEFLALASLAEGHPVVVLEAFAAGKSVLASDVKGNRDLVVEGPRGFLFEPHDDERLAQLIVQLSNRSPEELARIQAELSTDTRFDLDRLAEEHLRAYATARPRA